jgi:BirA family biotin operon repressor/biotin-[acetyl-CoA-carboxylase] ligase
VRGQALISTREHFPVVGSTNDVVAGWLADGVPEVCLAIADEQSAGRGRDGRSWTAPPGRALMLSLGFRPTWLDPSLTWRLAAVTSLAMADAAEVVAGLATETIRLKWPNDLVVVEDGLVRKLAGVLGETAGLGTEDPRAIVGIGINVGWEPAAFPPELAHSMTSLYQVSGGGFGGRDTLLDAFLTRLEAGVDDLRIGVFEAATWAGRQITTGQLVELHRPDGGVDIFPAAGVDPATGALIIERDGDRHLVHSGEIRHVRLPTAAQVGV